MNAAGTRRCGGIIWNGVVVVSARIPNCAVADDEGEAVSDETGLEAVERRDWESRWREVRSYIKELERENTRLRKALSKLTKPKKTEASQG